MSYVASKETWDALLQEDYVNIGFVSAINTATPFKDDLKRVGMTSGKRRVYPVKVGYSQGNGARAEGSAMPQYGAGEYIDAYVSAKYNYSTLKITGQAEEFGTKAAFVDFAMQVLKDTKEGLRLFTGRQCWGDGQGILALANGALAQGATSATVDSAYGVAWGSLASNTTFLIKRNAVIQFGVDNSSAENNGGQGYTVTGVSATGFTFTPALQNAVADDTPVVTIKSGNLEINGMLMMGATSTFMTSVLGLSSDEYHGIDRSEYPEWDGNVYDVNGTLTLEDIRILRDLIYNRTDDDESNLLMASTAFSRVYEALLQPAQRFVPATKLEGGHTVLEHDGLRVSKDSRAPQRAFFLADTKTVQWAQTRDPHWLNDGSGILRAVPGQDAKEGLLKWYSELDCQEPRRMGIGYNITMS